jgi:hypothetical protein
MIVPDMTATGLATGTITTMIMTAPGNIGDRSQVRLAWSESRADRHLVQVEPKMVIPSIGAQRTSGT